MTTGLIDLIDSLLDRITMYRLLLYYLIFLLAAATVLGGFGQLHDGPLAIILSASYLAAICWVSSNVFAYAFEAPTNKESSLITALILALIISPATTMAGVLFLTAVAGLAIASKYMLAIGRRHIFNPAAIAVVLTGLGAGQTASWWVGSKPMLPFVIAGGLLLARKIRRFRMITLFVVTAYAATVVYAALAHGHLSGTLHNLTLNSALFFLAFVMLTEPATSPAAANKRYWYAGVVGLLFPPQAHIASLYSTPELALIIGNVFSYVVEPKVKLFPKLTARRKLGPGMAEFLFEPGRAFSYRAGQYMEWTLPHQHSDSRGDRRYLTLASSPTERHIRLGVRYYKDGSSYKDAMLRMDGDTVIAAGQLSGDFILPADKDRKLAFIAGGIGVTPYRSMMKYMLDSRDHRDVTMLYSARTAQELIYSDVFEAAREKMGANVIYCLTGSDHQDHQARPPKEAAHYRHGPVTPELIKSGVPDYKQRLFYLSGSHAMVKDMKKVLRELGVHRSDIKEDFFPGYD